MLSRGFTLVELLVVVAIIGLFSAVALSNFNAARIKARNVKRASDLKQIQLALEIYYDQYGSYPSTSTWRSQCAAYGSYSEIPDSISASFSTLKYVNSQNFFKFRNLFRVGYKKGFICPAYTFDNVKGKFPIGFLIWNL
jgi:prepilin-type N-terminal cleavage/methylation domain-containing protein